MYVVQLLFTFSMRVTNLVFAIYAQIIIMATLSPTLELQQVLQIYLRTFFFVLPVVVDVNEYCLCMHCNVYILTYFQASVIFFNNRVSFSLFVEKTWIELLSFIMKSFDATYALLWNSIANTLTMLTFQKGKN